MSSDHERMTDVGQIDIPEDVKQEAHKHFNSSSTRQKWKNFSKKSGTFAATKKASYKNRIADLEATIFYQELEIQSRDEELVRMQNHSEFVQKNLILRNRDLENQLEFFKALYSNTSTSSDSDATNHTSSQNKNSYHTNNNTTVSYLMNETRRRNTSDDQDESDEEDDDEGSGNCKGYDEEKKL